MKEILITYAADIIKNIVLLLLALAAAYITKQIGNRVELVNVNEALTDLTAAAQKTVLALNQTTVESLKEYSADGKLTKAEITALHGSLIAQTRELMSASAIALLEAAGIDINNYILNTGEAYIAKLKAN